MAHATTLRYCEGMEKVAAALPRACGGTYHTWVIGCYLAQLGLVHLGLTYSPPGFHHSLAFTLPSLPTLTANSTALAATAAWDPGSIPVPSWMPVIRPTHRFCQVRTCSHTRAKGRQGDALSAECSQA